MPGCLAGCGKVVKLDEAPLWRTALAHQGGVRLDQDGDRPEEEPLPAPRVTWRVEVGFHHGRRIGMKA